MSERNSQNTGRGGAPEGGKRKPPTEAVHATEIDPMLTQAPTGAADATEVDPMLKALVEKEKAEAPCCTIQQLWAKFHADRTACSRKINSNPDMLKNNDEYENALSLFKEDGTKKILELIRSYVDSTFASTGGIDHESKTQVELLSSKIVKLSKLLEDIDSMSSPGELGEYDNKMYANLSPEQWKYFAKQRLEHERQLLERERQRDAASELVRIAHRSDKAHVSIFTLLNSLRRLTQAENIIDTAAAQHLSNVNKRIRSGLKKSRAVATDSFQITDGVEDFMTKPIDFEADSHFGHTKIMNSRPENCCLMLLSEVYNQALGIATFLERCDATTATGSKESMDHIVEESQDAENHECQSRTTSVQDAPEFAPELKPKDLKEYKKHIQDTIIVLDKTFMACNQLLQQLKQEAPTEEQSIQKKHEKIKAMVSEEMKKCEAPLYFPGPRVQECEGVQPIFEWLLGKVAFSLSQEEGPIHHRVIESSPNSKPKSPPSQDTPRKEKNVKEAAVVSNNPSDHIRYGDFICVKDGRHIWVYRGDFMPFIIEVKPLWRTDKDWSGVLENAIRQILAHTSKYVSISAMAGGVGANSHASGAIGTLAYILVLRLKVEKMETGEPDLVFESTKMLPLMTRENFIKYCKANPRPRSEPKFVGLENDLYGEEVRSSEILTGFLAMSQIVTASSSELFGHPLVSYANENASENKDTLGSVLGFGTFANVYSIRGKDCVAKISRFGREESLKAEAKILRALAAEENNGKQGSDHLCKFISESEVHLSVRGYSRPYRQIITSPKCDKGALEYIHCADTSAAKTERALVVFEQASRGLDFLHECGFVHNDLSSKNIMVKNGKVVLLDFSIASKIGDATFAGQGNLQTMHRACHGCCGFTFTDDGCSMWYPEGCHDNVSLAYAIVIMRNGSVPWPKLKAGASNNDSKAFEKRQTKAKEVMNEFFTDHQDACKKLLELIENDVCAHCVV